MQKIMIRRKLAIGVTGALMTALSIIAVAPVGAQDSAAAGMIENTSQEDTAAAQAQSTLDGPNSDSIAAYPVASQIVPAYVAPGYTVPGYTVPAYVAPVTAPAPQVAPAPFIAAPVAASVPNQPDGEPAADYQIDYSGERN